MINCVIEGVQKFKNYVNYTVLDILLNPIVKFYREEK
jgi:hypothetical protein